MSFDEADKQWIRNELDQVKLQVLQHVDEMGTRLSEHVDERTHDAETRLLRAFADYNANASVRFRSSRPTHRT